MACPSQLQSAVHKLSPPANDAWPSSLTVSERVQPRTDAVLAGGWAPSRPTKCGIARRACGQARERHSSALTAGRHGARGSCTSAWPQSGLHGAPRQSPRFLPTAKRLDGHDAVLELTGGAANQAPLGRQSCLSMACAVPVKLHSAGCRPEAPIRQAGQASGLCVLLAPSAREGGHLGRPAWRRHRHSWPSTGKGPRLPSMSYRISLEGKPATRATRMQQ